MIAVSQDVVGHLPMIDAPAIEMSTVLETVNQSELLRQELKHHEIVVVMDQTMPKLSDFVESQGPAQTYN